MTILRAGDLTPPDLQALVEELAPNAGERVRCWLDAFDGWTLDDWRGPAGAVKWNCAGRAPRDELLKEVLPRVTVGRVFAPSGELKWRILPALGEHCCRVVFLGDHWTSARLEALPARDDLAALSRDEATYPLWGQQTVNTPEEWIDLRIPHRLRYPVDAETPTHGRVVTKVRVEIWKDRRGEPQFIRLSDLAAHWEE